MEHYFTNNPSLKSELRQVNYKWNHHEFTFLSDNGVFSKDKIDFGSRFLVETILKEEQRTKLDILDVGCGYGFMGITLAKILKSQITLSDINKRALHLTDMNCQKNDIKGTIMESNCYESIKKSYDVIITNPPIRAGKEIVLSIILNAKSHLKEKGILWFVIRKDQGAKSIKNELEKIAKCEIIEKSKGFYIMRAEFS